MTLENLVKERFEIESNILKLQQQQNDLTEQAKHKENEKLLAQSAINEIHSESEKLQSAVDNEMQRLLELENQLSDEQQKLHKHVESELKKLKDRGLRINQLLRELNQEYKALEQDSDTLHPDYARVFGSGQKPARILGKPSAVIESLSAYLPSNGENLILMPISEIRSKGVDVLRGA